MNLANNSLYAVPQAWNFVLLDGNNLVKNGIFTITTTATATSGGGGKSDETIKLDVNIFGNPVL